MCFAPHRCTLVRHSAAQPPRVVRTCGVFAILTWKCASRHNGMHFFIISTSKSAPRMVCFVHFDFEMRFAAQRRALFQHHNSQKCSEREVFLAFSLATVLCATTACNFSSLIRPEGFAPAALASLLFVRSRKSLEKRSVSRLFYLIAHLHLFASDSFSSLTFFLLLFSSLTLPTSAFSSVHIVGSLTSKLSSIDQSQIILSQPTPVNPK